MDAKKAATAAARANGIDSEEVMDLPTEDYLVPHEAALVSQEDGVFDEAAAAHQELIENRNIDTGDDFLSVIGEQI